MSAEREIIKGKISLRGALSVQEEMQRIELFLKNRAVKDVTKLVYTGIRGTKRRLKEVLEKGISGSKITTYAHTAQKIIDENSGAMTALDYAAMHKNPLLIVYDVNQLTDISSDELLLVPCEYTTVPGKTFRDAIVAVLLLR